MNPDISRMSNNNMNQQQQSTVAPSQPSANSQVNLPGVDAPAAASVTSVNNPAQAGTAMNSTNPFVGLVPMNLNLNQNILSTQTNSNANANTNDNGILLNPNINANPIAINPQMNVNVNANTNVNAIPPAVSINNPSLLLSNLQATIGAISSGPTQVRYFILLSHFYFLHF